MEEWQKQFTDDNLPGLITSIRCDVVFLAYLVKYGSLSSTERERLNSVQGGEAEKASVLISLLQTRVGGYEHLTKALQKCSQTGAFSILLKGIQKHVTSKDILFGGARLPLHNVCQSIDSESLQNIIASEVNAETYEEFLKSEPWTLESETIPKTIPYYIPRTLSINTQIDPEIFEKLERDIFCVEGVELFQLSGLASRKRKHNTAEATNPPDTSRNQIHGVTTRLILLERPNHFLDIVKKTKRPVHWLKYSQEKYWLVKSSEIKKVNKFLISEGVKNVSEEEFIERYANEKGNGPVLIYDSPGMGKTVLLARLARKIKESRPEDSVVHFEISELVQKVRLVNNGFSGAAVKQTLAENIPVDGLGRRIMRNLLDSSGHQIYLFLDGYDEVLQSDSSDVQKMLDDLVKEGNNFRIFVATRPHRRTELEQKFGVLGYNILPFDSSNKLSFFLKYWQSQHAVDPTEQIEKFAEHCLKTLEIEMSGDGWDIAGVPLQCRMLAEIYAEEAKGGALISTKSPFQLNSIFQVYKHFVDIKFFTFCTVEERQDCHDFHVREALRTLFPENSKCFSRDLPVPENELIYRIGILEPLKSDSNRLGFSHRTLAEYFAAEFIVTSVTSKVVHGQYIDLLFEHALIYSYEYIRYREEYSFQNPVVCRFLNFFHSTSDRQEVEGLKNALRKSHFYNPKSLAGLLGSSLMIDAFHLYLFILDLYLDLEEFDYEIPNFLRFNENLQDTKNWNGKDAKKLKIVNELKEKFNFKRLVAIATEHSCLTLVKLSCEFMESGTGRKVHEVSWGKYNKCPIYVALQRGHYQIFEYLLNFDRDRFYEQPLLHRCLEDSSGKDLGDKVQIVKRILHEMPDLLNKPHQDYFNNVCVPLLEYRVHFSLIKCLIEAGADLTQTNSVKENIAHLSASHFSAEEYHELVEIIISRNAQILLKQRNFLRLTPVHKALMWIDLKSETLELMANKCNVYFNDNSTNYGSELAIAIQNKRHERVIKDIIRLGGDVKK